MQLELYLLVLIFGRLDEGCFQGSRERDQCPPGEREVLEPRHGRLDALETSHIPTHPEGVDDQMNSLLEQARALEAHSHPLHPQLHCRLYPLHHFGVLSRRIAAGLSGQGPHAIPVASGQQAP